MRIVVDTNVVVSGVFFGGFPRKVIEFWREKSFELICSPEILEEYEDVLNRLERKAKIGDDSLVPRFMKLLIEDSTVINPSHEQKISRDPDDDKFINCALSGKAIYIVSGDNDLLDIEKVGKIKILTAREFVEKLSI